MTDPLLDFTDKTVLITGSASGFGKLLAQAFGARGANLVLADIDSNGLDALVGELQGAKVPVCSLTADVGNESDHQQLVAGGVAAFGSIDIAINNAGVGHAPSMLHKLQEDVFDAQMRVNLNGVMLGMKHQLASMIKTGGGSILNVSSIAGTEAAPGVAGYSASKHAVIGLTKTAAVEYAKAGIRVNAVCPFLAATPIIEKHGGFDQSLLDSIAARCPMGRIADPQEIVNTMVMLCSPANSYLNGQAIIIDGGVSAH